MLLRLLAAFILVPLVELYLLLKLSAATSVPTTLLVVIVTGIIGTFLARREGVMAWVRFQSALAEGRMPSREIQDGLMIVFAAALLLTPGLLTDALGFMLLIPIGRDLIRRFVLGPYLKKFKVTVVTGANNAPMNGANDAPMNGGPTDDGLSGHDSGFTIDAKAVHRR